MNRRERLIAQGVLIPPAPRADGDPTPQTWRDEPTVRLSPGERSRFEREAGRAPSLLLGAQLVSFGSPWPRRGQA